MYGGTNACTTERGTDAKWQSCSIKISVLRTSRGTSTTLVSTSLKTC